ncbi:MAG: nuclease PIN [Flavobacteriales bacterium]|nr:nuclease PIN [Flavobacteriales bacterium]|tara:strand:- start:143 stop:1009 length:867 start_codon:yes stop_codon:yes gene_type:complete
MSNRSIRQIIPSEKINMGGIILQQPLPNSSIEQIDPFLLIHHGALPVKKGKGQSESGVGPHPHRGFSPVTFVFKGGVQHQDSLGNNEIVTKGGTQWINAGKGIIHSERPTKEMVDNGGENEIIQFWVNTPAKHKMESPDYIPLSEKNTPTLKKDKATIQVVAGNFENTIGPAKTYSPQTLLRFETKSGAELSFNLPKNYNTLIYLLDGCVKSDGKLIQSKHMAWYENDEENIKIKVLESSRFIILSGEPLKEPLVTYGPFVMNTREELNKAILDYQNGKMGTLIEVFD